MSVISNQKIRFLVYGTTFPAILVSLLQGLLFCFDRNFTFYNMAAISLAAINVFVGMKFLRNKTTELLAKIILLYCAQLAFFVFKMIGMEPVSAPRLLEVALILLHATVVASVLLSRFDIALWPKMFLLCTGVATLIFFCECILPFSGTFARPPRQTNDWPDAMQPHNVLGSVYRPSSSYTSYYAKNPRGYFKEENVRRAHWWFRTGGNSTGEVVHPSDRDDGVRIQIKNAQSKTPYDIQMNWTALKVQSGHSYDIVFQSRADRPRSLFVGFAQSHEPWIGLGLYNKVELKPEWQGFQIRFVCNADENNARIHFDLGESEIPVELADVDLLSVPDGRSVDSENPKYFVDYRFNALGCRGPDYLMPKPPGIRRFLVLGDSYAMGAGVYEQDTFTARIQNQLTKDGKPYEVINCGADDYGVEQQRLFYNFYGSQYQPDVVLLVLTTNANLTVLEEFSKRGPLFHTWSLLRKRLHPYDFDDCAAEILQFNGRLRNDGCRLAVIVFRNNSDFAGKTDAGKQWNELTRTVTGKLDGMGIPVLDLGKTVFKQSGPDVVVAPSDDHPNHVAHAVAAEQVVNFLRKEGSLN